jgi:hypothetical protein
MSVKVSFYALDQRKPCLNGSVMPADLHIAPMPRRATKASELRLDGTCSTAFSVAFSATALRIDG